MEKTSKPGRAPLFERFLNSIERAGNKLPDPVIIFMALCCIILLASWIAAMAGWSATHPTTGATIESVNLLNGDGLKRIVSEAVGNFATFPPLAMVLVAMLGIGVAEKSGWFETLMRATVERASGKIIVPVILFVAIIANAAGDAGPIVLPPLAAMVFIRLGYHPVAGLVAAYATCLGAFAANLLLGMTDVLAFAFTQPAAASVDPDVHLNVAMNYYFIAAATLILVAISYFVTMRITIPRMGSFTPEPGSDLDHDNSPITDRDRRAMRFANIAVILVVVVLLALTVPENGLLRNAETGSLTQDFPLMNGIIVVLAAFFFVPGLVYAISVGTVKNSTDLARMMIEAMSAMAGFIVIVFFAAQMLAYFSWSNLGQIMAIKGAEALENQSGVALIIGIILLSMMLNLVIGSASAKWAILAPIFVPMLMFLGYHPAFTQMLYRIGDSVTNPITPMMPYMPLLLSFAQRYVKNMGIGTLIAALMPYSIAFFIAWTAMILLWFFMGWPLGPDGLISYDTP